MIIQNICFNEFRYDLHADFMVLVDFCMYWDLLKADLFLHQVHSNKCLGSFATIAVLLTYPGIYFALFCLVWDGACLSIK